MASARDRVRPRIRPRSRRCAQVAGASYALKWAADPAHQLSSFEVKIDDRGGILFAQHDQVCALSWPDSQRGRMVDEVLLPSQPPARVTGQDLRCLVFRAKRPGNCQVARRERDAHGRTQSDRRVEKTQNKPRREYYHNAGTAAAPGATPPWTAPTLLAHVTPPSVSITGRNR